MEILRDASQETQTYFLGSGWSLIEATDTNGQAGDELVFDTGNSVKILRDASQKTQTYYLGDMWEYIGPAQLDDLPGRELRFIVDGRPHIIDEDQNGAPWISSTLIHGR